MLIFTRRTGERVRIGDDIVITVLFHSSGQVKLGVEAPPELPVDREEVRERREQEKPNDAT